MVVKIDKYVSIVSEDKKTGWIRNEENEEVIIKVLMDNEEHTARMLQICLDALNSGEFEDEV